MKYVEYAETEVEGLIFETD
jgi:hypothetical protein